MSKNISVKLICHASILINIKGVKILTDPWFFGTAFNDGWELSPQPNIKHIETLIADIDMIWISHEHPDHLHFPTLKWLAKFCSKDVKIFFQKTNSEKVFNALSKLGFKNFISMPHCKKIKINDSVELSCYSHRHLDSSLAVFINNKFWLLNINDTELSKSDTSIISKKWGHPTIVYNQFSIAGTDGIENKLTTDAKNVLKKMTQHHLDLKTKLTVPFASFVRFARSDNNYMNIYRNNFKDVKKEFDDKGLRICLQNYDSNALKWSDIEKLPDNLEQQNIPNSELDYVDNKITKDAFNYLTISALEVKKSIEIKLDNWKKVTNPLLWNMLKPINICVTDWENEIWSIDFIKKTFTKANNEKYYDILIGSQPLEYAFKVPFGIQTLGVSGRYKFSDKIGETPKTWKIIRIISSLYNAEIYISLRGIFNIRMLRWIWQRKSGLSAQILQQIRRFY